MSGSRWRWTPDKRHQVEQALRASRTRTEAAAILGITADSLDCASKAYGLRYGDLLRRPGAPPAVAAPPSGGVVVSGPPRAPEPPPEPEPEQSAEPAPQADGFTGTVSLLGDLHAPEQDRLAWDACLRWHQDRRPDLVVVTEMAEWLSMTKYGGNWGAMFDDDVKACRRALVQLRSVNPDARIVMLEANHDRRIERRLRENMPQLAGHFLLPHELKLDDLGIEWVPETVAFRVGRLKVIHGHQLGSGKAQMLPENACKRAIQRFGEPGWTVVFFHTHRRGYWAERHDTGQLQAVNLPCLRTLAPDWTAPAPTGWSHGFGSAYVGPSGQTSLYIVGIEQGACFYAGKRYTAFGEAA